MKTQYNNHIHADSKKWCGWSVAEAAPLFAAGEALCVTEFNVIIKKLLLWGLLIIGVLAIASCASQPEPSAYDSPGFFMGLLHGFIILFSFIGSMFMDIRMYAFPNSGVMYDFGYLMGSCLWLVVFVGIMTVDI